LEDNKDITYVDVSQNKIESLDSLRHLAKLEIVKAAHNQIKAISVDSLTTSAATLKAIILNNNELRSIPRSYSPFKLVNTLVVSHNEIENLKGIEMYPNLKKLSASNNAIRSLPLEIKRLVGLAELRLAHNKIMTLPDSISDNVNLKMLILNDNMINSFE
jgi:Leucine-rich repeat (LRR) protein